MRVSRIVEIVATAAILLAVAFGGRLMLLSLQRYRGFSATIIALAIIAAIVAIRRDYRGSGEKARLAVTRDAAYLTALLLILWAVIAPARWIDGSAIAMTEVAIAFDVFTRIVTRQAT